jgi:hypothetical protein
MKYKLKWNGKRTENRQTVPVLVKGENYEYKSTQVIAEEHVIYGGDFEVEVDIDAILRYAAHSAANNKNGRSQQLGGWIKAKRLSMKELQRLKKDYPVAANATQLEEVKS